MLSVLIWWACILLESLILLRGWRERTLAKYPFFYLYMASLFLSDGPLYVVYRLNPAIYPQWNWAAGFLNIVLGCGILLEVFRHVLAPYPGAEKLARTAGLAIFGVVFCSATIYLLIVSGTFWFADGTHASGKKLSRHSSAFSRQFGRCYPLLRHLDGEEPPRHGSRLWIVCRHHADELLAIRFYAGRSFNATWIYLQPASYLLSLCLFGPWRDVALLAANPTADPTDRICESSYESVCFQPRGSAMG